MYTSGNSNRNDGKTTRDTNINKKYFAQYMHHL